LARTPAKRLNVSIARAVGALHGSLERMIDAHPKCPAALLSLADTIEEFEDLMHDPDNIELRDLVYRSGSVMFCEADLRRL